MKQSLIVKALKPEIKALWDLSHTKMLDGEFMSYVQDAVRRAKDNVINFPPPNLPANQRRLGHYRRIDQMQEKFEQYGNTGRWSREKIKQLAQMIYQDKSPENIDLGKWISVEIECLFWNPNAETVFVSHIRKMGKGKFVTIKQDGSIRQNEEMPPCGCTKDDDGYIERHTCQYRPTPREIVITFKDGDWAFIKDLCAKLRELKTHVNKTCGLHVHFDCRHLKAAQVTTIGKRVAQAVPALKQILPASRSNNRFCVTDINSHRSRNGREDRYSFVNLMSYERHKTLEIRGHSGTIDGTKIVNWIRILQKIMLKRNRKPITTASEMVSFFAFEPDLVRYVSKRFDKFNPVKQVELLDDVADDHAISFDLATGPEQEVNLEQIVSSMQSRADEQRVEREAEQARMNEMRAQLRRNLSGASQPATVTIDGIQVDVESIHINENGSRAPSPQRVLVQSDYHMPNMSRQLNEAIEAMNVRITREAALDVSEVYNSDDEDDI